MPVNAIDVNGDSVLFYSESGDYLGYSNDNQRYKDRNLLVVISNNNVANFSNEYTRKRDLDLTGKKDANNYRESLVAGLACMGSEVFDVTAFTAFFVV